MRIGAAMLVVLVLWIGPVCANPPQDISIAVRGSTVEVFVTHPSSDPGRHYIKTIIVSVNDIQVSKQLFSSQGPDGQSATYEIKELRSRDRITVYAACSVYGDLAKTKAVE